MIAEETSLQISELGSTKASKARILLTNVTTTITEKPGLFETFVTILEEESEHLAKILRTEVRVCAQSYNESGNGDTQNEAFVVTASCIEERQQLPLSKRKPPTPADPTRRELKNAMENLYFAKLESMEKEARLHELKKKLKCVKKENVELKEEKRTYIRTIDKLTGLLEKKEEDLKYRIPILENKLAETERKKYEAIKERGQLIKQVSYLHKCITNEEEHIEELLAQKQSMEHDLHVMVNLLQEADAKSQEFNTLEANYETMCQQLEDITEEFGQEQCTCTTCSKTRE